MATIIYGRAFKTPKKRLKEKEGVSFLVEADKWIVRAKNKNGNLTTLRAFENKKDAIEYYNKYKAAGCSAKDNRTVSICDWKNLSKIK